MRPLRKQIKLQLVILLCFLPWISGEPDEDKHRNNIFDSSLKRGNPANSDVTGNKKPHDDSSSNTQFPRYLDLQSLQNIPLVILRPKVPLKLHLISAQSLGNVRNTLNSQRNPKSLDQGTSNTEPNSRFVQKPQNHENFRLPDRNRPIRNFQNDIRLESSHLLKTAKHGLVSPRQFQRPMPQNGGWMNRIRGSVSNFLPRMNPFHRPPMLFPAPTMNNPMLVPPFGGFHPFAAAVNRPVFVPPFHPPMVNPPMYNPFMQPQGFGMDELAAFPSNRLPIGAVHPSMIPQRHAQPLRHPGMSLYEGGDLFASASGPVPVQVPPPGRPIGNSPIASASTMFPRKVLPSLKNHLFANYAAKFPRHRPLFNNVDGLGATSMEITNAFADFADSPEHGHDVNQRFGAVGDSLNKFLQMMGLGVSGFTSPDIGAFGGAGEMASLESTPISRSFDFFPGYGNQANLEHLDDEEIFEEDITELFSKKFNKPPATTTTKAPTKAETKKSTTKAEEKKTTVMTKPTVPPTSVTKSINLPQTTTFVSKMPSTTEKQKENTRPPYELQPPKVPIQTHPLEFSHQLTNAIKPLPVGDTKFYYSDYLKNNNQENLRNMNNHTDNNEYAQAQTLGDGNDVANAYHQTAAPHSNIGMTQYSNQVLYPTVDYKIPSTYPTAKPDDHKPPVLIYHNLPPAPLHLTQSHTSVHVDQEQGSVARDQSTGYAPAHSITGQTGVISTGLVDSDAKRQWTPMQTGQR